MENSIEMIWKQGFLNESSLVAPKVNDLYNRKSIHVVERIKRRMKNTRTFNFTLMLFIPVIYYFLGVFWYGLAYSTMALFMLWYTQGIINSIKRLDQGANSYEYLKSFDSCLNDIFEKMGKIVRFSLPIYCFIGLSAIGAFWTKMGMFLILQKRHPTIDIQLCALVYLGTSVLLAIIFSVKIYKWEVRVVYGRLLNKLEETIIEMDKLKQGE